MSATQRNSSVHGNEAARWAIGLNVSYRCRRVEGVLIAAVGGGSGGNVLIDIKAADSLDVPEDAAALFRQLCAASAPPEALPSLRIRLAETQAKLCEKLISRAAVFDNRVLAAGVYDPGMWSEAQASPRTYMSLCDAARLAELTGLNVIDAFAARDLARGGQGGPATALSQWILLRDPLRERLLLDLGRTVHMSYLPAGRDASGAARVFAFDVGPGTRLLDELVQRLTGRRQSFDRGGSLAVQGRRIEELLRHWLSDPSFNSPIPRWHPCGIQPQRFLADAIRMAVDADWSVRDLLCTATHLIAESVVRALRRLPDDSHIDQILLTGGGRHNGMLLRELGLRLPGIPLTPVHELGVPDGALAATSIAVLTLCNIEKSSGAFSFLGSLTPGSPRNWQRLLDEMSDLSSSQRPLRKAV